MPAGCNVLRVIKLAFHQLILKNFYFNFSHESSQILRLGSKMSKMCLKWHFFNIQNN